MHRENDANGWLAFSKDAMSFVIEESKSDDLIEDFDKKEYKLAFSRRLLINVFSKKLTNVIEIDDTDDNDSDFEIVNAPKTSGLRHRRIVIDVD